MKYNIWLIPVMLHSSHVLKNSHYQRTRKYYSVASTYVHDSRSHVCKSLINGLHFIYFEQFLPLSTAEPQWSVAGWSVAGEQGSEAWEYPTTGLQTQALLSQGLVAGLISWWMEVGLSGSCLASHRSPQSLQQCGCRGMRYASSSLGKPCWFMGHICRHSGATKHLYLLESILYLLLHYYG